MAFMRLSATLPPLPALRAFEAAGRLLSFRQAGEELLITQSAVSHHIRQLEDSLGVALFIRHARGVTLTTAGARYLAVVCQAFDLIAGATRDVRGQAARRALKVSMVPSFAANWLAPRLARFAAAHPDIDLTLDPTLDRVDVAGGAADIGIRYGPGPQPGDGLVGRLLHMDRLAPVASPDLLRRGPPLRVPADLLAHPLLFTLRPFEWDAWAVAAQLDLRGARTLQLTDYNIVLQAAVDGQGVAMGRALLIEDRIRAGLLVRLFPGILVETPRVAHWLVWAEARTCTPAMTAFMDWITAEVAAPLVAPPV
ncbi:LysR substrate-binding domain-containing protein [Nitrospirillum iridis]|uniref:LysR family glycine cleavage system transcriptional activator n=1 Tax=Nitrospirillum iridis TaxID=765888 RepID=A0A7X0ECK4_9PROT|nr:LysR substrate-binding domain-containing protein [Nitrospirillum iridis]MBB6251832.1 LysR family glycine cleavage system transcriptional activator [Nitrospirillum iridis]